MKPNARPREKKEPPFVFGPVCGEHCGTIRRGKVDHCPECHAIMKDRLESALPSLPSSSNPAGGPDE